MEVWFCWQSFHVVDLLFFPVIVFPNGFGFRSPLFSGLEPPSNRPFIQAALLCLKTRTARTAPRETLRACSAPCTAGRRTAASCPTRTRPTRRAHDAEPAGRRRVAVLGPGRLRRDARRRAPLPRGPRRAATAPAPAPAPSPAPSPASAAAPKAEAARPLYPIAHVTKLYSHPQAWGQCTAFLARFLGKAERCDAGSTSGAAERVAADGVPTSAAVSSELAARLTGLTVLARHIQDRKDNRTRFFVLRRRDSQDGAAEADLVKELAGIGTTAPRAAPTWTRRRDADARKVTTLVSFAADDAQFFSKLHKAMAQAQPYLRHGTSIRPVLGPARRGTVICVVEVPGDARWRLASVQEALTAVDGVHAWKTLGRWHSDA